MTNSSNSSDQHRVCRREKRTVHCGGCGCVCACRGGRFGRGKSHPSQLSDVVFLLIAGVFWFLDVAIRRDCAVKLGVDDAVFRLIILYLVNSISLNRN